MPSLAQRLYGTDEAVAPVRVLRAGPLCLALQHGRLRGCIRFDAEAVPAAQLQVNRLGLCLLHPLSACGARVTVTPIDGRTSASTFPALIPPWPPFMLVRALRHEWAPRRWALATRNGDSFETEDQRNNGDALFKTYSRSNMAPRPYRLAAGLAVRQSAELCLDGPPCAPARPQRRCRREAPLRVALGADTGASVSVGVELQADDALEPGLLPMVRNLRPAHLHLAWRPGAAVHWPGVAALHGRIDWPRWRCSAAGRRSGCWPTWPPNPSRWTFVGLSASGTRLTLGPYGVHRVDAVAG